jgi:hypothetical protein
MGTVNTLLGAAVFAAVVAAPAAAEYVRLGSVDVGYRTDTDTAYSRFGGRLENLRLIASRSDVFCRAVVVQYENGERQNVFSGKLDERQPVEVDLRGHARKIDSISFACRANEFRGGHIFIEGDVGHFRDEWRHDRDWDRTWSGLFGGGSMAGPSSMHGPDTMGGPGPRGPMGGPGSMGGHGDMGRGDMGGHGPIGGDERDFVSLGSMSFEGRNDKESNFAGFAGRHVERLAFRPLESDAQCGSIVATFEGGSKAKLADGRTLERGRLNFYDLPGYKRNLSKIFLRCHALSGYQVTIEIFARR